MVVVNRLEKGLTHALTSLKWQGEPAHPLVVLTGRCGQIGRHAASHVTLVRITTEYTHTSYKKVVFEVIKQLFFLFYVTTQSKTFHKNISYQFHDFSSRMLCVFKIIVTIRSETQLHRLNYEEDAPKHAMQWAVS